jgi:hypothetical protein
MTTLSIPHILDAGEISAFTLIDSSTFVVVRPTDEASALIMNAEVNGADVSPVTVGLAGAGGSQTIVFTGVFISGYSVGGDGTESVRFSFQTETYQ